MLRPLTLLSLLLPCVAAGAAAAPATRPVIPIHAWIGIPAEHTSVERYRELADCGFTTSFSGFGDAEAMLKALDAAQAAGVKLFIHLPALQSEPEVTVRRFKDHPALAGYHLRDEPSAVDFASLAAWTKRIQAVDAEHPCYINLFPTYASPQQLGVPTYEEHVRRFVETVPVPFISFDHYPVIGATKVRGDFYHNLEVIRAAAAKADKPFWAFCLSVAHGPYPRPMIEHLRLQAWSNLAYGAACIQYFTYWTPASDTWNFHEGPIDAKGKRTATYDVVRQMNREIQARADIFAGSKVLSVGHVGTSLPHGTKAYRAEGPVRSVMMARGSGVLVSRLRNGGREHLALVNASLAGPATVTVSFDAAADGRRVDRAGAEAALAGDSLTATIEPGDLLVLTFRPAVR